MLNNLLAKALTIMLIIIIPGVLSSVASRAEKETPEDEYRMPGDYKVVGIIGSILFAFVMIAQLLNSEDAIEKKLAVIFFLPFIALSVFIWIFGENVKFALVSTGVKYTNVLRRSIMFEYKDFTKIRIKTNGTKVCYVNGKKAFSLDRPFPGLYESILENAPATMEIVDEAEGKYISEDGSMIVRRGKALRIVVAIILGFDILSLLWAVILQILDPEDYTLILTLLACTVFFGIWFAFVFNYKVTFNGERIIIRDWFITKEVSFDEVAYCKRIHMTRTRDYDKPLRDYKYEYYDEDMEKIFEFTTFFDGARQLAESEAFSEILTETIE